MNTSFTSHNFSFIVSGSGSYQVDGQSTAVAQPMVITQRPGHHYIYGPETTWSELFLIYDQGQFAALRQGQLWQERHHWPLTSDDPLRSTLNELLRLAASGNCAAHIDTIDRLSELLIISSLRPPPEEQPQGPQAVVLAIREWMEGHLREPLDLPALLRRYAISQSHFRRHWAELVGIPPQRYWQELRLRQACRELVEGTAPVAAIAQGLGFSDQLYFARCFRRFTGETATDYRRHHRLSTGLQFFERPAQAPAKGTPLVVKNIP